MNGFDAADKMREASRVSLAHRASTSTKVRDGIS
jgi:hypothetical protein